MTNSSYMTRALRSNDKRYALVLGKLGYTTPATPAIAPEVDELAALRAEYERVLGKKVFNGWDADALREKIAAARG